MTIDKIKYYMSFSVFEYWTSLHKAIPTEECKQRMLEAKTELEKEIEKGIRNSTKAAQAEIMLLNHLTQ